MTRRVEVIGHTGAGAFYPGNSRGSVEYALSLGVDRIEVDVQRTRDGVLVLVHDERLRIGGRWRPVRAMDVEHVRAALPGLLTLPEYLALIAGRAAPLIDVKAPGYERTLIAGLATLGREGDVLVTSTYAGPLVALRRAYPWLRIGLSGGHPATMFADPRFRRVAAALLRPVMPGALVGAARLIGATDLSVQHRVCSPALVEAAHAYGLGVFAWTVDRPDHIARVLDHGVDGVISNRPDRVKRAVIDRTGGD